MAGCAVRQTSSVNEHFETSKKKLQKKYNNHYILAILILIILIVALYLYKKNTIKI